MNEMGIFRAQTQIRTNTGTIFQLKNSKYNNIINFNINLSSVIIYLCLPQMRIYAGALHLARTEQRVRILANLHTLVLVLMAIREQTVTKVSWLLYYRIRNLFSSCSSNEKKIVFHFSPMLQQKVTILFSYCMLII